MVKLQIDFKGNNRDCSADVELEGIVDAWTVQVTIIGHPTIKSIQVTYRLGDFLTPMIISKQDLEFFSSLLDDIQNKAETLLPKEQPADSINF